MEGVVLLTRVVPGGAGPGRPPQARGGHQWGDPMALGVAQVLLGAPQLALGGALLGVLGDPLGAQLGAPLGTGGLLLVSGSLLLALPKNPKLARAGVALGAVTSCFLLLALLGQALSLGLSLSLGLGLSLGMGPGLMGALWGVQALLLLMGVAGAGLAVTGAVTAGRGGAKGEGTPMVIYQTALPSAGAGLAEATPPISTP